MEYLVVGSALGAVGDVDDNIWADGRLICQMSTSHMRRLQATKEVTKHISIQKWERLLGYELDVDLLWQSI